MGTFRDGDRAATGRQRQHKGPLFGPFVVALLRNSRKTERGAGQFLVDVRCAPHPLRFLLVAVRFFLAAQGAAPPCYEPAAEEAFRFSSRLSARRVLCSM